VPAILQALPAPQRVTVVFDGAPPSTTATDYTVLRSGATRHTVAAAWTLGASAVELALDEPLVEGAAYTCTCAGATGAAAFVWRRSVAQVLAAAVDDLGDPEAEAWGEDTDWLSPQGLTPSGDLPAVRGVAALRHDLAALAHLSPGELVHRPAAGMGLAGRVNGSASDAELDEAAGAASVAYRNDPRVAAAECTATREPAAGRVRLDARVMPAALTGESIALATRL
jgi:hypothetical protein